ncbi:hypothetical protein BC938DRAFT_480692, partial [Jimgerdemannia flammicorona]
KALIAARYNGLEIETPAFQIGVDNKSAEFLAKFPHGKVPAFEGADGTNLFESSAIAFYVAAYKNDTTLFGKTKAQAALVQQWMSFADTEITPNISAWVAPIRGWRPYNKPAHDTAVTNVKRALDVLNKILLHQTYLVGEQITLADISVTAALLEPYKLFFDKEFRNEYKNVNRWFATAVNQKHFKAVLGEVALCEVPQKYVAPKKDDKKEKKEEKPKVEKPKEENPKEKKKKEEEDDDDEPKPEPKPKSALDLLPPSALSVNLSTICISPLLFISVSPLVLDEWKRFYSNNETIPNAMNWLWEHFDPQGWSIWKVDYKYNEDLTLIFMSSNLIGGFFNRLERARKYAFGSMVVTGENNKNAISGYFIIRGQEIPEEVYDAADFESYTFVKVDSGAPDVRSDIAHYFAWTVPGFQDGKVYK